MVVCRHGPVGPPGLRGRARECALLADLASAIRRGESRSLVVRGEARPGSGRPALLDHMIASAADLRIVTTSQFTSIGMEAFAERARNELQATGEKVRQRTVETREDLTVQGSGSRGLPARV